MSEFYRALDIDKIDSSKTLIELGQDFLSKNQYLKIFLIDTSENGSQIRQRFRHDTKNAISRISKLKRLLEGGMVVDESVVKDIVEALGETAQELEEVKKMVDEFTRV